MILFKKQLFDPWGQRSRSHKGHYGTRHTALRSCTNIPNIIDLSGKTKKLWSGQASLRRSRRSRNGRKKNQTKTICLPSFDINIFCVYHIRIIAPKRNGLHDMKQTDFVTRSWSAIIGTKQPKFNQSPQQWQGR